MGKNDCSTACCHSLQQTIGKVAGFLSESADSKEKETRPVTLTGISVLLNASPESVHESLISLRESGAIKLERRRIVISDMAMLQDIAVYDR